MLTGADAIVGAPVARRIGVSTEKGKLGSSAGTGAGGRGLWCLLEDKKGGILGVD